MFRRITAKWCAALVLAFGTSMVCADPYCCPCKGGPAQTIDVGDDLKASFECTVACKRFTLARPGACESAAAPVPAAATASSGSAGVGLPQRKLFRGGGQARQVYRATRPERVLLVRGGNGWTGQRVCSGKLCRCADRAGSADDLHLARLQHFIHAPGARVTLQFDCGAGVRVRDVRLFERIVTIRHAAAAVASASPRLMVR